MALTTNQGLILPDGTDNANVPLTFTDFVTTAGSGIENRLVQRYLSIADRTTRNPAPNEGELSYLTDLNRYDSYTGSAWIPLIQQHAFSFDATGFNSTSTVYTTVGGAIVGATVVVPQSGQVRVDWGANTDNTVTGTQFVAPQLNSGAVVGAGGVLVPVADTISVNNATADSVTTSSFHYYSGLTVGSSVNAFLFHRVTANTGAYANRKLSIQQA
jgi:hypothetical protein